MLVWVDECFVVYMVNDLVLFTCGALQRYVGWNSLFNCLSWFYCWGWLLQYCDFGLMLCWYRYTFMGVSCVVVICCLDFFELLGRVRISCALWCGTWCSDRLLRHASFCWGLVVWVWFLIAMILSFILFVGHSVGYGL